MKEKTAIKKLFEATPDKWNAYRKKYYDYFHVNAINIFKAYGSYLNRPNLKHKNLSKIIFDGVALYNSCFDNSFVDWDLRFKHVNMQGSSFRYINWTLASLTYCNLYDCNIIKAELSNSMFSVSNLVGSTIVNSKFYDCDFSSANISCTNIENCLLEDCDLFKASLYGTRFKNVTFINSELPPVTDLLRCNWSGCSDDLVLELMRYDCSLVPNGRKLFDKWKAGEGCPYNNQSFGREAVFAESSKLWKYGRPKSALTLVKKLFKEFNITVRQEK